MKEIKNSETSKKLSDKELDLVNGGDDIIIPTGTGTGTPTSDGDGVTHVD